MCGSWWLKAGERREEEKESEKEEGERGEEGEREGSSSSHRVVVAG
jgi:hypothetical protein